MSHTTPSELQEAARKKLAEIAATGKPLTPKDLAETYLPAFERLVGAGVEAVMGAYNRTLDEPCCASRRLLVDTLRGRWGVRDGRIPPVRKRPVWCLLIRAVC